MKLAKTNTKLTLNLAEIFPRRRYGTVHGAASVVPRRNDNTALQGRGDDTNSVARSYFVRIWFGFFFFFLQRGMCRFFFFINSRSMPNSLWTPRSNVHGTDSPTNNIRNRRPSADGRRTLLSTAGFKRRPGKINKFFFSFWIPQEPGVSVARTIMFTVHANPLVFG